MASSQALDSLEALVAQVQGLSGTMDDLGHLQSSLKQAEENLGKQGAPRLSLALQQLHPTNHSLGYLFLLEAQTTGVVPKDLPESFIVTATHFINVAAVDQIRLAPEKFTLLCRRLKEHNLQIGSPMKAILPLKIGIQKLQPSAEYLTPLHGDLFMVCLLSKCYKAGLSVLEEDIFEIDKKKTGLVPRDFLLYCYYGGMIYIGLKQFHKAFEFFQHAITAPATSLSAITIEAYKKYTLVSLIQNGLVPPFPKYTPSISQRSLKSNAQAYVELENAFNTKSITDLKQCVSNHEETFKNDNNLGLAKQVVASLYKRNIQRLTQTYLTLSLQDIAETVMLESAKEAELHVLGMIKDGEIFATINQKDGMVSFHEDPEQYKTRGIAHTVDSAIRRIMALEKKLLAIDEQILCDPAYLSKMGRDRSRYELDDFEIVPQRMYQAL